MRDEFKRKNDVDTFRISRNKVCNMIKKYKNSSYERKVIDWKSDPKSIWTFFKEYGASSQLKNNKNLIKEININGTRITENLDIVNEFISYLVSIAENLKEPIPNSDFDKINEFVNQKIPTDRFLIFLL